ncbi:MAG: radical SAM family heme chaperone HemW [Lactobacillus sp.]|jgi:oxygen-independent coproporphyrinogen-3 oxidase|nr:radical SAM family heme chaperone HemW [Lactobacillus sp.]
MKKLGIYIHWPFCLSKCPYCDFFSEVKTADEDKIISAYIDDLDFYHNITHDQTAVSIFFGGGTPSLIKPINIEKLINHIHSKWNTAKDIEISLEANPNTHRPNLFSDLKSAGINRLSLGVQALNNKDLKFLGRTHNLAEALKAIDEVTKTFDNHSMDLIYARPNQKSKDWEKELVQAANLGMKHLSLYQLTIEEGTPFYKMGVENLDEDNALLLYELTEKILESKGYNKYEVSNFSQKNFESKHNLGYWQGRDYLGVGQSSHGRIGLTATHHHRNLEKLTPMERAAELLLMGLRITEGIDKKLFHKQCGIKFHDFVNTRNLIELKQQRLLEETDTHIFATNKGFPLLNKIIEELAQ